MKTLMIHSKKHGSRELIYDEGDEEFVSRHSWYVWKDPVNKNLYYCRTNITVNGKQKTYRFHRLLLGVTDRKIEVDHINHNGLDNRRENLRVCDRNQNQANARPGSNQSSVYKGVYFKKNRSHRPTPWIAQIQVDLRQIHLGCFSTEEEAALAYNRAALIYFGEFAFLNDV